MTNEKNEKFELPFDQLPEPLWKSIARAIESYTVALVHRDELIGSGTLIQVDHRYGILTAYHVPHNDRQEFDLKAGSSDKLGLILSSSPHCFEIPLGLGLVSLVDIAKPQSEAFGPDLAFVEIRASTFLADLQARKFFFQVGFRPEERISTVMSTTGNTLVSGFYAENPMREKNKRGFRDLVGYRGFAAFSPIRATHVRDGLDFCDLGVAYGDPRNTLSIPQSFGGFSGGGVWHVELTKKRDTGVLDHRPPNLAGVIFYQEETEPTTKILRAHHARSIYEHCLSTIKSSSTK